jgi:hypothetical protein
MTVAQATYAERADFANRARNADNAQQATYSMVSKEAEQIKLGSDVVIIDPANHYVIMYQLGTDPSKGIIFDVANHALLNVDNIVKSDGTAYSAGWF